MAVGSNPIAVNPVTGALTWPAITADSLTVAGTAIAGTDMPMKPADRGCIAWNFPLVSVTTGSAMSPAGTLQLARIRRVPAGPVTSIVVYLAAAGATLTTGQCFAALFTAAGTLVAQTADQATAWASTGLKTMALAGGPVTVAAGDYYAGFWYNGTTGPSIARPPSINAGLVNAGLSAPNFEMATADTGLTTAAPASFGTQTAFVNYYWVAIS